MKQKPKKKVKPTAKQKRFVKEKLKGKSDRKAAIDAGYSKNTAKNATPNIVEKRGTQSFMETVKEELRKLGVDEHLIAQRLYDSMYATKLNNAGMKYTDWTAVHRAIDKVGSLNDIATEKIDITSKGEKIENVSLILGEIIKPKEKEAKV